MKRLNRFEEVKVKMVMKLKGISRREAIASLGVGSGRQKDKGTGGAAPSIAKDDDMISAEDFFRCD